MKIMILAGVALLAMLVVVACGGIAFTAANAPALFGEFDRRADVPYGTGPRQRLDVYSPRHATGKPIIVFWYGGGWENGAKSQYRFVGAALAKAGYVAVLPDYRLFPEVKFPAFVRDGAEAVAWVVSHAAEIGGDPKRIYLAGHSAGAHLAAMLAYDRAQLELVGQQNLQEAHSAFFGVVTASVTIEAGSALGRHANEMTQLVQQRVQRRVGTHIDRFAAKTRFAVSPVRSRQRFARGIVTQADAVTARKMKDRSVGHSARRDVADVLRGGASPAPPDLEPTPRAEFPARVPWRAIAIR